VPVQLVNFAFSPLWLRVPLTACVSFLWTCQLSIMRGGGEEHVDLEVLGQAAQIQGGVPEPKGGSACAVDEQTVLRAAGDGQLANLR